MNGRRKSKDETLINSTIMHSRAANDTEMQLLPIHWHTLCSAGTHAVIIIIIKTSAYFNASSASDLQFASCFYTSITHGNKGRTLARLLGFKSPFTDIICVVLIVNSTPPPIDTRGDGTMRVCYYLLLIVIVVILLALYSNTAVADMMDDMGYMVCV